MKQIELICGHVIKKDKSKKGIGDRYYCDVCSGYRKFKKEVKGSLIP